MWSEKSDTFFFLLQKRLNFLLLALMTEKSFIDQRLDSLYEIDCKIVSLLDSISGVFESYSNGSDAKDQFSNQSETIYKLLSEVAITLRKEVKIMDDNIGVYDKNDDKVMILPISVDQKNTKLGEKKLQQILNEM